MTRRMFTIVAIILATMESLFLVKTLWYFVMVDIFINLLDYNFGSWGVMMMSVTISRFIIVMGFWVIIAITFVVLMVISWMIRVVSNVY